MIAVSCPIDIGRIHASRIRFKYRDPSTEADNAKVGVAVVAIHSGTYTINDKTTTTPRRGRKAERVNIYGGVWPCYYVLVTDPSASIVVYRFFTHICI